MFVKCPMVQVSLNRLNSFLVHRRIRRAHECRGEQIGLGYSVGRPGVGGVRNHLRFISEYSQHSVLLYPSESAIPMNQNRIGREGLSRWARQINLANHPVVHSHVDPNFIRKCSEARDCGSRWVHTYHTLYFADDWGGKLAPWQGEINRALIEEASRADVRIAISPWLQDLLRVKYQVETELIPNGVDVASCEGACGTRFARKFGIVAPYVLFLGSNAAVKNPGLYIELAESMPKQSFVMVGKGLTPETLRLQYPKVLPSNLTAVGPLAHGLALDAVAGCSVFVMTSRSEGFPTALLEAMTLGKPCVAPASFGCGDAIGSGECGIRVPVADVDVFRDAVSEAFDRLDMGVAAAHRIREHFDWKVVIPQIDTVYSRLLDSPRHV